MPVSRRNFLRGAGLTATGMTIGTLVEKKLNPVELDGSIEIDGVYYYPLYEFHNHGPLNLENLSKFEAKNGHSLDAIFVEGTWLSGTLFTAPTIDIIRQFVPNLDQNEDNRINGNTDQMLQKFIYGGRTALAIGDVTTPEIINEYEQDSHNDGDSNDFLRAGILALIGVLALPNPKIYMQLLANYFPELKEYAVKMKIPRSPRMVLAFTMALASIREAFDTRTVLNAFINEPFTDPINRGLMKTYEYINLQTFPQRKKYL